MEGYITYLIRSKSGVGFGLLSYQGGGLGDKEDQNLEQSCHSKTHLETAYRKNFGLGFLGALCTAKRSLFLVL
jgi:hypothetical protein